MKKNLKNYKISEAIVLLLVSLPTLVIGILLGTGYLRFKPELELIAKHPEIFTSIIIIAAIFGIVFSIYVIWKKLKYKKNSVYYVIKNMDQEAIKNKLSILSSDKIEIDDALPSIFICLYYNKITFNLLLEEKETIFYVEETEDYLTDEEIEKIDNLTVSLDSTKIDEEELFNKFIKFVNKNLELVLTYGQK
jgi:hypothetical protein